MKRGVLLTECRHLFRPPLGVRLHTLRLVSLSERAIGLQVIQLEIEEGEVEVTLEAAFEEVDLELASERIEQDLGVWRTKCSDKSLAMAATASLQIDGHDLPVTAIDHLKWSWNWKSHPGQVVSFERSVAVTRSDTQALDPGAAAREKLEVARHLGWRRVLAEHETAWASRWQYSDVEVDGDAAAQQALRLAIYHLNGAANPADERVSIGARALTGDDYHGHVFWDTEIFLIPFYILTWPEAARTLLVYRFRTLDAARSKAARLGWRGAFYAWESADTGAETTPEQIIGPDRQVVKILCGKQEQHISADVAYAVWQYWQATGDEGFLLDAGAEILLETGRFWSSRAQPESDGYCHIRGVIGPDEYHEDVDDNAFTNVMARWNIRRALDVAALLRERWPKRWVHLSSRLRLHVAELNQWLTVAETMATGLDSETGLFEQFAGFFDLEEIDLADYAGRSEPMDVVLGRERVARSQVIKQADVLALLALLPEVYIKHRGGQFPLLRASLRPRQLAEPRHAWARRRPAGLLGCGAVPLPEDRGDSSCRYASSNRLWRAHSSPRRHLADGGVRFCGAFIPQQRRGHRPATAGGLAQPWSRPSVAWPPFQDQDRSGQAMPRSNSGRRRADGDCRKRHFARATPKPGAPGLRGKVPFRAGLGC
jgi:trehalose/maltose hydrolase-like predicted phosphorylase